MPTVSISDFLERLDRSRLLVEDDLAGIRSEIEPVRDVVRSDSLGRKLVKRGLLTDWQLQMLLSGREAFFLGNYKLLDLLGRGGMGTVMKAEHVLLGRIVAIKVMAQRLVRSPKHVARFQQEIQAAAALDSPHVVRALDAESVGDTHFLVMEYVDGQDLARIADRRGRLPVGEACEYMRQVAIGLDHAHQVGLVHRDLKPANMMLTWLGDSEPIAKILDMGLARFATDRVEQGSLTKTGQMMGTPDYMSPEQAWDTKSVDIRGDIYSLGCTLFRFLVGTPPFQGENPFQTLMARTTMEARSLRSLDPELPEALDEVVARMLARDPADRYQEPSEVVRALEEFAEVPWRIDVEAADPVEPAGSQTVSDVTELSTQTGGASLGQFLTDLNSQRPVAEQAAAGGRGRIVLFGGIAAATVLLVAVLAGLLFFGGGGDDQARPPSTDRSAVTAETLRHPLQPVDEGTGFVLAAIPENHALAARLGDPAVGLRMAPGSPEGVALDRQGTIRWTPTEAQGPGEYKLEVQVRDTPSAEWRVAAVVPVVVREHDRPPKLEPIGDRKLDEDTLLELVVEASDPDLPQNTISYSLAPDAPPGVLIQPRTGRLIWRPTEKQGPGQYTITVRATAMLPGQLDPVTETVETSFAVTVREVDQAPVLRAIPSVRMRVGQRLRLKVKADDPDDPPGPIRFRLQGRIPTGAVINAETGIFSWAPTEEQAPAMLKILVRAASGENPDLFTEGRIVLDVRAARVVTSQRPIPDAASVEKADRDVRDQFKIELAQARSLAQRAALASRILERAAGTGEPATAYSLFHLAHETALRARYALLALDCVELWLRRFRVDEVARCLESFTVLRLMDFHPAQRAELSERAVAAAETAVTAARLGPATQLLDQAIALIRTSKDPGEMSRVRTASVLLKKLRTELGTATSLEDLSDRGKSVLEELRAALDRLTFTPVFREAGRMKFVRHVANDLEDLGRSLWSIDHGDVRLEVSPQNAATGFWDKTVSWQRFRLRARLSISSTTGVILIGGGSASSGFDGLQLDLRPDRFLRVFHRGTNRVVAAPAGPPKRRTAGWDYLELRAAGQHIVVAINGNVVVDATVPGNTAGFIGLDAFLGAGSPRAQLELTHVRVREEKPGSSSQ